MSGAIGINLGDLLGSAMTSAAAKRSHGYDTTIDHEVQIERLKEDAARYAGMVSNGCQFKVADIVTPRAEYSYNGVGQPHVVLEVLDPDEVIHHWGGSESGSRYGCRHDMRIAVLVNNDSISHFWVESCEFEHYVAD